MLKNKNQGQVHALIFQKESGYNYYIVKNFCKKVKKLIFKTMKGVKILIVGDGRIGKAISHFLKKKGKIYRVDFFGNEANVKNYDILIGAMPGKLGDIPLKLALKYKKDLIDVSELNSEIYFKNRAKIEKKKIRVIAGCGFCPGLTNLIIGYEIAHTKNIKEIEVKVGSLSRKNFYFPFLWCFEDLIAEYQIPSWQRIKNKNLRVSPFSGYQKEEFYGIDAESYYGPCGFDYLITSSKIPDFTYRLVNPEGFYHFFKFLENHGFLEKENFEITKRILEEKKKDNLTFAQIKITTSSRNILWQMSSFSKKREKLNSMQKITGILPVIMTDILIKDKIKDYGLFCMENIGKERKLFSEIIENVKKEKVVTIFRKISLSISQKYKI